jgi:hypothetical protein
VVVAFVCGACAHACPCSSVCASVRGNVLSLCAWQRAVPWAEVGETWDTIPLFPTTPGTAATAVLGDWGPGTDMQGLGVHLRCVVWAGRAVGSRDVPGVQNDTKLQQDAVGVVGVGLALGVGGGQALRAHIASCVRM